MTFAQPTAPRLARSRLRLGDVMSLGTLGMRGRPTRTVLSGLGIAIGIACVVAVLGISASSQARLLAQIDALGTNLLTVTAGTSMSGDASALPTTAPAMIGRIHGVENVASTGIVDGAAYRNQRVPAGQTSGLTILATSPTLPRTLDMPVLSGEWLSDATANFPVAVLGATAARRLGVEKVENSPQIYVAGQWFTVIGILGPSVLDPTINSGVLVGFPVAQALLNFDGHPTTIYERSTDETVESVRTQLALMTNPDHPDEVNVTRPSDALAARAAAQNAYTGLFLGLGAVALLVGSIGIANVMVIGVLERRGEVGLRRALGATRAHIRWQFLVEGVLLSTIGGVAGAVIGVLTTIVYATIQDWEVRVPAEVVVTGITASILSGVIASLYPSARAARLPPTEALRAA
ncbi:ABC transporter permease [Rugosimonospora africana]|uniref:ABC transporter permease n=1 Tax=Rugosimonospora africana TaxID=556532 RepID=A0A8J3VNM3_9ACTN|nr:ABC transporter permease [Rugosimonospora africana]GIH13002.1 ABC transporter permease [Rugosimonospora africana]